jgi:hypothetical protein
MTYTISRCRSIFTRQVTIRGMAGGWLNPVEMNFYGADGRTVRAEAAAWAKRRISPEWRPLRIQA